MLLPEKHTPKHHITFANPKSNCFHSSPLNAALSNINRTKILNFFCVEHSTFLEAEGGIGKSEKDSAFTSPQ